MDSQELLTHVKGGMGWIILNRPKVLNALSLTMIQGLSHFLKKWEQDSSIKAVVIQGAGDKAFCAGGDVRAVYEAKHRGDTHIYDRFFREEYTLNTYIKTYPKPYVSLIDGVNMGGGLGVSVNGTHRIVTEKALMAMPETGIGFFTDVGATAFLNKIQGAVGLFLGLTGTRLKAADALWSGFATHYLPSHDLPSLKTTLEKGTPLEEALATYCHPLEEQGFLAHHAKLIENHFHKSSLKEILESLAQDLSPFAQNTYNTLMTKSPTSLAVVFRQLTEGKALSFHDQMKQEFRLSQHMIKAHDFSEGIRSVLIDKDHLLHWKPSCIEDLTQKDIDTYFESLGNKELIL